MDSVEPIDSGAPATEENVWDNNAEWWAKTFASDDDDEYVQQILPMCGAFARHSTLHLDLGAGEGQIARAVSENATCVIGVDASARMLQNARGRTQARNVFYVQADVMQLPFANSIFSSATASLVLEHVDDIDVMFKELSRVLIDNGRVLVVLNHPFTQSPGSGWIDDQITQSEYFAVTRYLGEELSVEHVTAEVQIPFFHRPLSRYINAASDAALVLERMIEPAPPAGAYGAFGSDVDPYALPRLVFMIWRKGTGVDEMHGKKK